MSNWKHAYGWYGHIIMSDECSDSGSEDDNVICVKKKVFDRLYEDYAYLKLDKRIEVEQIGVLYGDANYYLATGTCFSNGFEHYGTVFTEADIREGGGASKEADDEYISAMKEIYGIDLPPCKPMIGCSTEQH